MLLAFCGNWVAVEERLCFVGVLAVCRHVSGGKSHFVLWWQGEDKVAFCEMRDAAEIDSPSSEIQPKGFTLCTASCHLCLTTSKKICCSTTRKNH